jgi:NADH-quinone oxidoreductase subunit J
LSLFDIFFYLFAAAIVGSAAVVCFSRNIVHAAFSLLFTFFGVAGIYVLLSADFLAVSQILIYVGGILVLLVFGVMLTNRVTNIDLRSALGARIPALIICGALLALLISILVPGHWIRFSDAPWSGSPWKHDVVAQVTNATQGTAREVLDHQGSQGTAVEIGKLLLSDYLLPFELISIVLIVALIGAAMIARRESNPSARTVSSYKEEAIT